mgnify:FL=1|tara:strand:- start:14515 stop:15714 length:1200 start_codon:yes stop_codon:yes gene_type:complete
MFSGTVVAQLVNFASYPFLTRMYSPEDFGVFSIFLATASAIGMIACGRYDAVIQTSKAYERFAVFKVSQFVNLITTTVCLFVFLAISFFGEFYFNSIVAVLLGIAIFLTGLCNGASLFILKHEHYKENSLSAVLRTLLTAIPQVGLFYLLPDEIGLIVGFVLGFFAQAIYLLVHIKSKLTWRKSSNFHVKVMAFKYKHFFQVDVPSQFLSVMSLHLLSYLLLFLYSTKEVGYYSMAFRLASLPLAVFSASLSQVFFQKAAKSYREKGRFWLEMRFNVLVALVLAIIINVAIFLWSASFIKFYLGEEWLLAADILVLLSPMITANFVYSTISVVPLVINKPKILLLVRVFLSLGMLISFLIAHSFVLPLQEYLLIHSFLTSIVYFVFIGGVTYIVRLKYS